MKRELAHSLLLCYMTMLRVCDMEGRSVEYENAPTVDEVIRAFDKRDCCVSFYMAGGDEPLRDFNALFAGDADVVTVHAVYTSAHEAWLRRSFPPVVANVFGGYDALLSWPRLPWQPRFRGATHYIDGIYSNDIGDEVGMVGEDPDSQRPFVAFVARNDDGRRAVVTLFQRYTKRPATWAFSGQLPLSGCLHKDNVDKMSQLFSTTGWEEYETVWKAEACA